MPVIRPRKLSDVVELFGGNRGHDEDLRVGETGELASWTIELYTATVTPCSLTHRSSMIAVSMLSRSARESSARA